MTVRRGLHRCKHEPCADQNRGTSLFSVDRHCQALRGTFNVPLRRNAARHQHRGIKTCPRMHKYGSTTMFVITLVVHVDVPGLWCAVAPTPCTELEILNLSACDNVGDPTMMAIASNLVNLRELDMSACEAVTEEGVFAVVKARTTLKNVNFNAVPRVNDQCITLLARSRTSLTKLNIAKCPLVRWQR